jgi:hypothetical protein
MFLERNKEDDFTRQGSLKSLITFEFCGNVKSISVREKSKYRQESEEADKQEYYLIIEDSYGWQCSYFRQGLTLEKAQTIAAKIPYGRSILISGEVAVRKGNTYFNAIKFKNPDETDILLISLREDQESDDNTGF